MAGSMAGKMTATAADPVETPCVPEVGPDQGHIFSTLYDEFSDRRLQVSRSGSRHCFPSATSTQSHLIDTETWNLRYIQLLSSSMPQVACVLNQSTVSVVPRYG
jgi:hypothetical protein